MSYFINFDDLCKLCAALFDSLRPERDFVWLQGRLTVLDVFQKLFVLFFGLNISIQNEDNDFMS